MDRGSKPPFEQRSPSLLDARVPAGLELAAVGAAQRCVLVLTTSRAIADRRQAHWLLANTPLLFSAALHASVPASSRDEEINGRLSPDRAVRSSWVATAVVLHASSRQEQQLSNKVYVGNLPFSATESDLRSLFEAHGAIESVNVITDRETGRARGFAFVEMQESGDAANAIRALDGSDMDGRSLRVNEAQDKRGGGGPRNRY